MAATFGTTQPATTPTATATNVSTTPTQSLQMPVQGPQAGTQYNWGGATQPTTSQANSATPMTSPTASTTTLSNGNKINQVPAIQATTNNLATNGITTDQNGNANYANGTSANSAVNPTPAPLTPTNNLGTPGISQGGYVGDTYYASGSVLPTDGAGQPLQTTPTSPTDDLIMNNLNKQLAQADAMTATVIQGIQSSYSSLMQQQETASAN